MHESFLPAEIRAGYGLPNSHERDAIFAYYFYRRAKSVSENAMEVIGVVKKAGMGAAGMVDVTFLYEVGGKRYKKRKSLDQIEGGYYRGQEIELVVDSRNPGRCYLKSSFYSRG